MATTPIHVVGEDGSYGGRPSPDPLAAPGESGLPFVAESRQMKALLSQAKTVGPRPGSVIVTGETGTGKTMLCRLIHKAAGPDAGPFKEFGCGEFHHETLISELFGHKRGAWTGATMDREGVIAAADGGVLVLNDIDCLDKTGQQALLRFLDDGQYAPMGDKKNLRKADVRVFATTNRDLTAAMRKGTFRQDLFYRLGHWHLTIPPLRDRPEDIQALAEMFLAQALEAEKRPPDKHRFTDCALELFCSLPWPGNIRELEKSIRTIVAFGDIDTPSDNQHAGDREDDHDDDTVDTAGKIDFNCVSRVLFGPGANPGAGAWQVSSASNRDERIFQTLTRTNWNISLTSRIVGCSRTTIYACIQKNSWMSPKNLSS